MFKISKENVYQRTAGSLVGYISLILYLLTSIYLVYHSKTGELNVNFLSRDIFRRSLFCRRAYPVPFLRNHIVMGVSCDRIDICADADICREFIYG